jgi:DNA primase
MSRIPSETLEKISSKVEAADIIGRYVQLKTRGRKAIGLCPFHNERTPSFSVDLERGLWYCFGCSEGGSVYNFLMRIEGLNFPQAVKKLADEVGVPLELNDADDPEARHRDHLRELLERTAQYYSELLFRSPLGQPARDYLTGRGLTLETAEKFRLGWAPASGDALARKLEGAGYRVDDGVQAGVVRQRGKRDLLRGRLVFPITTAAGKVVAFGGRIIEANPDKKVPKYLNTPETPVYSKREHLYGLSFHRGEISRAKEALVMEGYLDVIAVSQAGYKLSVASLGTALTLEQCRLLSRYARRVHLFYDADRAGRSATEKAIDLFEQAGLLVNVSQLEQGEDPDSIIQQKGSEAFGKLKDNTVGVVDYLMTRKSEEFDLTTRAGKDEFSESVLPAIAKIRDEKARNDYCRQIASKLFINENVISDLVEKYRRGQKPKRLTQGVTPRPKAQTSLAFGEAPPEVDEEQYSDPREGVAGKDVTERRKPARPAVRSRSRSSLHAEERLLSLMLRRPEWNTLVFESLKPEDLSRQELSPFLEVLLQFRSIERPLTWTDLELDDQSDEATWARLMAAEVPESTQADMERLISDIKRNGLEPRYEMIRQQVLEGMKTGSIGPDSELYREYRDLQKRLKGTRNE